MIQIIIKYGRPIVLAIKKSGSTPPPIISWIWGTITGTNWGTSTPGKLWGVPESTTAPANLTAPTITGAAIVGQTLTINGGTWSAVPYILKYDIYRGATLLTSLATSNSSISYTVLQSDMGGSISCVVSAINSAGTAVAPTSNTVTVLNTLLDLYPNATAAYSVRLLRGAYYNSPAIRVRRSNDNAEQNIGFTTSGNLDTSALTTFVGVNSGFIVTWFDQSGNARNGNQLILANQPRIVNAGTLDVLNGKASLLFDGTNDSLPFTPFNFTPSNFQSFVGKRSTSTHKLMALAGNQYLLAHWIDNKYYLQNSTTGYIASNVADTNTNYSLITGQAVSGVQSLFNNNNNVASAFVTLPLLSTISSIGNYINTDFTRGQLQETIFYNSDQSLNRTGINNNINNYYGIYTPVIVSDPDAQAFVDAASITSQPQADVVNTLVIGMKAQGLWTKTPAVYPMVGGTAYSHKFNLKDPRDLDAAFRLAFSGTWTHSSTGATPNGTNAFADTFLVCSTEFNTTTFNHFSYYSRSNTAKAAEYVMGSFDGVGNTGMIIRRDNNSSLMIADYPSSTTFRAATGSVTDSRGFFLGSQTGANIKMFKNNILLASNTGATLNSAQSTRSVYIGALNSTPASFYTDKECAFASIGQGLSDAEVTSLNTLVQAFQTSLGRNV